jgi:hypothetical protein
MLTTIPNPRVIADRFLGTPYADADCWDFTRLLYKEGFGVDLASDQLTAAEAFVEVWWHESPTDPLPLLRPWDLYISMRNDPIPFARHVGIVLDGLLFVHARAVETGACIERCRHWRPKLLQVARWRPLV